MKNLSRSLTRSRSCQAFVVLSADSTDSPSALYASPKMACAIANLGSISTARRKKGIAAAFPEDTTAFSPMLYAFKASSRTVSWLRAAVVECFSTVASDSPTRVLNLTRDLAERVQDVLSAVPPGPALDRECCRCCSSWRASPTHIGFQDWQSSLPEPSHLRFARRSAERFPKSAARLSAVPSAPASAGPAGPKSG